jgi:hypothetical protein
LPVLLLVAGCAGETIVPDEVRTVQDAEIAPYEVREECAQLAAGERLDFRFESQAPVTFNLYYREGPSLLAPLSREDVTSDSFVFRAPLTQRYCLRWEAGRQGAIISYRARVLPASTSR